MPASPCSRRKSPRLLPFLLLAACDSPTAPATVVDHGVSRAAPLVWSLSLTLDRAAPVTVEYGTDDGPWLQATSEASAQHRVLLTRLRAGRTYRYKVTGTDVEGELTTGPLPPDLADVSFAATGAPTIPLALLHLRREGGFHGYAAVDREGEVVWYWRTDGFPYGAARRPDGTFAFLDAERGLVLVSPAGEVMAELPQPPVGQEMHHDIALTPAGTVLYLAFDSRDFEGSALKGESIWEWAPGAGAPVKRWSSWDHLSPDVDRGLRFGGEWLHANSLAVGPQGNVLVSLHFLNQVLSIAPGWGSTQWRLGGVNATVDVPAELRFSGQHTAREVAPSRVVLFDNALERGGPSRALELELRGSVATRVWEWSPPRSNFSSAVSSARRLEGGGTLVGFGMSAGLVGSTGPIEVYEVSPQGEVLWHLEVGGTTVMFRAEPIGALAGEVEVPNRW